MKGRNELILNEATIIEAVQEYLDKRMPGALVVVSGVKSKRDRSSIDGEEFTVKVDEKAQGTWP